MPAEVKLMAKFTHWIRAPNGVDVTLIVTQLSVFDERRVSTPKQSGDNNQMRARILGLH